MCGLSSLRIFPQATSIIYFETQENSSEKDHSILEINSLKSGDVSKNEETLSKNWDYFGVTIENQKFH